MATSVLILLYALTSASTALAVCVLFKVYTRKQERRTKRIMAKLWGDNANLRASCSSFLGVIQQQSVILAQLRLRPVSYGVVRTERRYIPFKIKKRVYAHYSGSCAYCRVKLTKHEVTTDHIIPLSAGGSNHISNLCTCCNACNQNKGSDFLNWHPCKKPLQK